jgi:anthranilate synthase component 1
MNPSFEEFKELSRKFNRITVYKETEGDMDTPISMLSKLLYLNNVILLESAKENKVYSRFSFLAFGIKEKLILKEDGLYKNGELVGDISYLKNNLLQNTAPALEDLGDFSGGYVGYFNFEFVEQCHILRRPLSKRNETSGVLYLVEKFCVYDNYTNRLYIAISRNVDGGSTTEKDYQNIKEELKNTENHIKKLAKVTPVLGNPVIVRKIPREDFINKVKRVKGMIVEGEAIQVVLSDLLEVDNVDPFKFYRNLRKINPSPYMYFIKDEDTYIVGSSPEVHIRIRNRIAVLRPIAGTKPRDKSDDTKNIINVLTHDEKEKAEHLMLVDLARNDLSRICKVGGVEVESFMEPEVYSHVVHLVSQVRGELADDVDLIDAIEQTFPAGTVTGAPKTRAIEIIDELEEEMRGVYAGCTGYIGFNGNVDMAITIRTAVFTGLKARLRAGAGIVYDSIPEREYEEIMNKLKALIRSGGIDDSIDR